MIRYLFTEQTKTFPRVGWWGVYLACFSAWLVATANALDWWIG